MMQNFLGEHGATDIASIDPGPTDPIDRADWLESKQQFRPVDDGPDVLSVLADPWQDDVRRFTCPVLVIWEFRLS